MFVSMDHRDIVTGNGVVFREHDMGAKTTASFSDITGDIIRMVSQDHVAGAI